MFACLYLPLLPAERAVGDTTPTLLDRGVLSQIAYEFSPRVEALSDRLVLLDVSGLGRLLGDAQTIGHELRRAAADRPSLRQGYGGSADQPPPRLRRSAVASAKAEALREGGRLPVHVVVAATRVAAVIVAHARAGVTVVAPGEEAATLAPLSLRLLEAGASCSFRKAEATRTLPIDILRRWGLKTLGDLAALPRIALSERLGQDGLCWQRMARGEDVRPLVPERPEAPFDSSLELEWPIDGLEPLSFVLGRLFDPLCRRLEEEDRAAIGFTLTLHLVSRAAHGRTLSLPAPVRDPKVLRTLVLLDLESHPPPAAIDRVTIALDPTPGRIVQYSLLTRPLPQPEQISTMMARLTALVGEGRSGSPALVDTHRPGAFVMQPFAPGSCQLAADSRQQDHKGRATARPLSNEALPTANCILPTTAKSACALRRFRIPIPARVSVEGGRPSRVTTGRRLVTGGAVRASAGPWRSSGDWWKTHEPRSWFSRSWDRDEWDVALGDGAVYRIFFDRVREGWFIEAVAD